MHLHAYSFCYPTYWFASNDFFWLLSSCLTLLRPASVPWQDEYGNIQMKEAMRLPVLFGMLAVKAQKNTFHRKKTPDSSCRNAGFYVFILMKHNQFSRFGNIFYQHFNQIPVVETSQWGSSQSWAYLLGAAWTGVFGGVDSCGPFFVELKHRAWHGWKFLPQHILPKICKSKWQDCFHCSMTRDHN